MMFTKITRPEIVSEITITGTRAVKIEYESGATFSANNVIWSLTKNRGDNDDPSGGTLNILQLGSSAPSLVGVTFGSSNPVTINATDFSTASSLETFLIANLI
jgi:hypothetical protein